VKVELLDIYSFPIFDSIEKSFGIGFE